MFIIRKQRMKTASNMFLMVMIIIILSCATCQTNRKTTQNNQIKTRITNTIKINCPIYIQLRIYNSTFNHLSQTIKTFYSQKTQQKILPIPIQIFPTMQNLTISTTLYYQDNILQECIMTKTHSTNLTRFKKINKVDNMDQNRISNKGNFTLHIAQDFNVLILLADTAFPQSQMLQRIRFDVSPLIYNGNFYQAKYMPRLDISQMHIPYRYYKPIVNLIQQSKTNSSQILTNNQDISNQSIMYTVNIHIFPYGIMKYMMFFQMFDQVQLEKAKKVNPFYEMMMDESQIDDMKQIFFTNNLYIVILTFVMSFAKTILQIFALKNQIKIWKQIQKNKGLSLKILYTDLVFQLVFMLYLIDNDTNFMMILMCITGLIATCWKLKRTIYFQHLQNFPFIKPKHYEWCKHHQKIDGEGVKYMYYALTGLLVAYLAYQGFIATDFMSLLTYSSVLEKIVMFMGMAGFIRMTPQLYINYKLKSVDHLPWKTLIYRFIQTIIDDFYVFLVTTPLLQKVMVFRQDVIFLGYIYQRIIYKVDTNRIGTSSGATISKVTLQSMQNKQKSIKKD